MLHSLDVIGTGLFAFLGASLILGGLSVWARATHPVRLPPSDATVFLFEGQRLVDATPAARRLLRAQATGRSDLDALLRLFSRGFGADLGPRLAALPMGGRLSLASPTGAGTLDVAEEGGALRLTLRPDQDGGAAVDRLAFDAAREELQLLRGLAEDAPHPIWALDADGALTWANRAYLALADRANAPPGEPCGAAPSQATWPVQPLFEQPPDLPEGEVHQERLPLALPGWEEPLWFDVTTLRRGTGSLHFATDVTGLVQAEAARLHFVQTLAKTFAHLSTGLAIFNRDRRLVLFNPAFLDLTGLPIDFLSGRPLVQAVLDRLRDAKILPEPRDYASWRESVVALEAAAAQGQYHETWTLPGGQTWRVTGRPHPDGALAFLFEDISGEVGLTRRFRAELEATRDALDAVGEAVALFSPTGALTLSNAAYDVLWGPSTLGPGERDLASESACWEAACLPSPAWTRLGQDRRDGWEPTEEEVRLTDGRLLAMRVSSLPRGATLVTFQATERQAVAQDRLALAATEPVGFTGETVPA